MWLHSHIIFCGFWKVVGSCPVPQNLSTMGMLSPCFTCRVKTSQLPHEYERNLTSENTWAALFMMAVCCGVSLLHSIYVHTQLALTHGCLLLYLFKHLSFHKTYMCLLTCYHRENDFKNSCKWYIWLSLIPKETCATNNMHLKIHYF